MSNDELASAVAHCLEPTNCATCPLCGRYDCMDIMFKLLGERLNAQHLEWRLHSK